MPIALTKELPGATPPEMYNLYIVVQFLDVSETQVVAVSEVYQSLEHFKADFMLMIRRVEIVTDKNTVALIRADYTSNIPAATATMEEYLISKVPWYAGGTILQPTMHTP